MNIKQTKNKRSHFLLVLIIVLIVLVNATLFISNFIKKSGTVSEQFKVPFQSEILNPESRPLKVHFKYSVEKLKSDKFSLQSSRKGDELIELDRLEKSIVTEYQMPGYYQASLYADSRLVARCPVDIPSRGWELFVKPDGDENYFCAAFDSLPDKKSIQSFLDSLGLVQNHTEWNLDLHIKKCGKFNDIDNRNFVFRTRIKELESQKLNKAQLRIKLVGEQAEYLLPFTSGEVEETNANKTDKAIRVDFSVWQDISFSVEGKSLKIYVGDELFATEEIIQEAGELKSIEFQCNFIPEIQFLHLI